MTRICPAPKAWNDAFERLVAFAQLHRCAPPEPPKPLILAGWWASSDEEKKHRWAETIAWAADNGCSDLVRAIAEVDFYCVEKPTDHAIGPHGGPMHRSWDTECRKRPSRQQLGEWMSILSSRWGEIAGAELARVTRPLSLTGRKARRLVVRAEETYTPPWGSWSRLSDIESQRRTFRRLRAAINREIAPHAVDHVDICSRRDAPQGA